MNKIMTKLSGLFLGLAMVVGVGVGLGQTKPASEAKAELSTYTHDFTTAPGTTGDVALSTVTWVASDAFKLGNYNGSYKGVQLGTSSAMGSYTLTTKSTWGNELSASDWYGKTKITKVYLWMNAGAAGSITATVKIGGTNAISDGTTVAKNSSASSQRSGTTKVTYTPSNGFDSGIIEINYSKSNAKQAAGYICSIQVECEEPSSSKTLSSIAVKTAPTTTTYYAGDKFNPSGLVITATYSDASTEDITYVDNEDKFTFSPDLNTELNTTNDKVTITYGGKSADQAIIVNARTMTSIKLHGEIIKKNYYVGETWDLTGLDLQVNWSVGNPTYVSLEDDSVAYECDPETAESVTDISFDIEVLYESFDESFTVEGLTVTERPKVYILDLDGGKTHTSADTKSGTEIKSVTNFNTAFPQASNVYVKYVSSSKFYASKTTETSTEAAKMGTSSASGNVTFGLVNSDKEYIKNITLDAYGWSGAKCALTISSGTETSKKLVISNYSDSYSIDLSSWNEPTQFTLTTPSSKSTGEDCRLTIFAISIEYGIKKAKSPIESYTVDSNDVSLNENSLQHTIVNTILPSTAEQGVTYTSSNSDIVEVSEGGIITAKTSGVATITCTTIGKDINGKSLEQEITVTINCTFTVFSINKDSASWPSSSSDTYATTNSSLIQYQYRRFQTFNNFIELNKHPTTSVEPTFGNVSSYSSPIKSIVISYEDTTQAGYASLYASKSNTKSSMKKDVKVNPSSSSSTLTYNFEIGNYNFFTLVNDANAYLKMSSIVVTLKNADETLAGTFIENYMHPELSSSDKGTGKCISEGWYEAAKGAYGELDDGVKDAFAETSYALRLQKWAEANGEEFNVSAKSFMANPRFGNSNESYSTILIIAISVIGLLAIGGYFFYRKRKEN